jgi:hypothetical protein
MTAEWLSVVDWNRKLFDGMQNFHAAQLHQAGHEYGKQVSRLTYATNKCAEAVNACAGAAPALREQVTSPQKAVANPSSSPARRRVAHSVSVRVTARL